MPFTIGADPEFFLLKKQKPFSAIGKIGGTKQKPKPLGTRPGFAVQEDNVAVEFNVPPAQSAEEFADNIEYVLTNLKKKLKGLEFSTESSLIFDFEQLDNPIAQMFGCEPDFNAWTKSINPRPEAQNMLLRSAGGHVHIGTKEDPIEVIRAMDLFVGVPSIVKDEHGQRRRELYGKPGAYRVKPFGCEYRVLSNFWIFSRELTEWVYAQTAKAIEFVGAGETIDEKHHQVIQDCISNSDKEAYEYLDRTYGITS